MKTELCIFYLGLCAFCVAALYFLCDAFPSVSPAPVYMFEVTSR